MNSLTKGKPIKVILLFAVPLYIGQLFQLGYSIIDTRIIGGILGEKALAAVGATISLSDMLIEFLNGIICILRNSMQGFGDTKTPLVSSLIELAGKVLIAYLLAPIIGYMGVIISEPVVWAFMVIPLLVGILRSPIWKAVTSSDA